MSIEEARPSDGAGPEASTWTSQDLTGLHELVGPVRQDPTDLALELELELELETAREALRVADEEIRVQRDQLAELLRLSRASTVQRRRVAPLLPVPMVTMDAAGMIADANAAAAAFLDVPLVRLVGRPLVSFLQDSDRGLVQDALSRATPEPTRVGVQMTLRGADPAPVDLVLAAGLAADPASAAECMLLPSVPADASVPAVDPVRLATAVMEISRLPLGDPDPRLLLAGVSRITSAALGDDIWASVNLGHPLAPTLLASSADEATLADGLQVRAGEGPCADAFDEQETVLLDDLADDARWPRLRAIWPESPAAAVLGVPLVAGGKRVGCLNCYGATPGTFGETQGQAAEVLALAAGAALEAVEETNRLRAVAAQLDQAMASRAVIDQAKGIVMARRGCTADEAFAHLTALSQQRNVKVRDLARALVEQTGNSASAGAPGSRRGS